MKGFALIKIVVYFEQIVIKVPNILSGLGYEISEKQSALLTINLPDFSL